VGRVSQLMSVTDKFYAGRRDIPARRFPLVMFDTLPHPPTVAGHRICWAGEAVGAEIEIVDSRSSTGARDTSPRPTRSNARARRGSVFSWYQLHDIVILWHDCSATHICALLHDRAAGVSAACCVR